MTNEKPTDETLESHRLRQLFERTQPERSEVDLQAIILSRRVNRSDGLKKGVDVSLIQRRVQMSFRAACLVAVAVVILGIWNLGSFSNGAVVLAQVKDRVESVRTVEYVEIAYDGREGPFVVDKDSLLPSLEEAIEDRKSRLQAADASLVQDLNWEIKILSELQAEGRPVLYVRRVRVKGKHVQRTDGVFPHGQNYTVRDGVSGMSVLFDTVNKRRVVQSKQVVLDRAGNQEEFDIAKIPPSVDFFARFTTVPNEGVEHLPSKELHGKHVVGLRCLEEHDGSTWTRTYWIDPETKLPFELWTELRKGEEVQQRWVMKNFVYDRAMDDALFRLETPEGYDSSDGKVFSIKPQ